MPILYASNKCLYWHEHTDEKKSNGGAISTETTNNRKQSIMNNSSVENNNSNIATTAAATRNLGGCTAAVVGAMTKSGRICDRPPFHCRLSTTIRGGLVEPYFPTQAVQTAWLRIARLSWLGWVASVVVLPGQQATGRVVSCWNLENCCLRLQSPCRFSRKTPSVQAKYTVNREQCTVSSISWPTSAAQIYRAHTTRWLQYRDGVSSRFEVNFIIRRMHSLAN